MKPRGRPVGSNTVTLGTQLMFWAYVELIRDRKGLPRLSARAGCAKLAKDFARDVKGGRFLTMETIRRHHKDFEKTMRRDAEEKAKALHVLECGRHNREILGWDASPWMFLIDPVALQLKGYELTATDDGRFRLNRPK
jgi:hypothetical protein